MMPLSAMELHSSPEKIASIMSIALTENACLLCPTLLISAVGVIDDAAQTIDMSLKQPGNLLYQIGITRNELAGSHYAEILGELQTPTLQETNETETEYSRGVPLRSPWGGVGMPTHSHLGDEGMPSAIRPWIGLGTPNPL